MHFRRVGGVTGLPFSPIAYPSQKGGRVLGHGGSEMGIWKDMVFEVTEDVPRIEWLGTKQIRVESHRGLTRFSPNIIEMTSSLGRLVIQGEEMAVRSLTADDATVEGYISCVAYEGEGGER